MSQLPPVSRELVTVIVECGLSRRTRLEAPQTTTLAAPSPTLEGGLRMSMSTGQSVHPGRSRAEEGAWRPIVRFCRLAGRVRRASPLAGTRMAGRTASRLRPDGAARTQQGAFPSGIGQRPTGAALELPGVQIAPAFSEVRAVRRVALVKSSNRQRGPTFVDTK
jgi:hypothetical protein